MPKVSILIPTYNDSKYIKETLDSITCQNFKDYEILICDDGSTDNTKEVVENYKNNKEKIKYIYQDNADQLNALINLIPYIKGEYVYILHSDDLLYDKDTLSKMVNYMEQSNVDSIIADMPIIDKDSNIIGNQKIEKYKNSKNTIALQLLWLGRNLYVDMAFHKKEVFVTNVHNNYLLWNGPFWLNIDNNNMLNVKNVDFPFFKYRVFEDNYLNSEGANYNVINGEIRVVTRLLKNYHIPFYKLQYIIYRVFNKLKLNKIYTPIYFNKESKNKYEIIKFVLNKRFTDKEIEDNLFLDALVSFYKNNTKRSIELNSTKQKIYYGKDMRIFNKKLKDNTIEEFYLNIFKEMKQGFNEVIIEKEQIYNDVVDLLKFLCIYPYVNIKIKNKKGENNE